MCGIGFIARVDGQPARSIVADGLLALRRLAHRGASDALPHVDGCGVMTGIPWRLFERESGTRVPVGVSRAAGMFFLGEAARSDAMAIVERELRVAAVVMPARGSCPRSSPRE